MRVNLSDDPFASESVLLEPGTAAHHYTCPDCYSPVRTLEEDGRCPRCAGTNDQVEVREANRRAGVAARAAQERRGRLEFLKGWR
jgi:hypothetical protein